jgi:uncharacterized membrane protein YfcA
MPLVDDAAIFFAGAGAGVINSVAGGGTLLSFPVLIWAGRDPIIANATNALALWPGSMAGAFAFRRELGQMKRALRLLLGPSLLGAVLGGWVLLATPSRVFSSVVPYLVLLATALMAAQRPLARLLKSEGAVERGRGAAAVLALAQLVVAFYGGYFGAGMGILMLAALGLYGISDIHQRNGLKNLLATAINGTAGIYFMISGAIAWRDALVLGAGAVLGGYVGASVGRRLPRRVAELVVVAIGIGATVALAVRSRH